MDSITQAVLGGAMGALTLGPKIGRAAIGWGLLLGTLPDLDAVLMPFLDTAVDLHVHRGFTHSLLFLVIISLGLARPLSRRWAAQRVGRFQAGWFVFLIISTHILIDCFTVYGTQVFWPFSREPVALDHLYIIDPLFTAPLLVATVWGLRLDAKRWRRRDGWRMTGVCVGVSVVYVGLSFWAKHAVATVARDDLAARGISWQRKKEAPAPFSIVLWRVMIERESEFWVGYRSLFDGDQPMTWVIYPKEAALDADLLDDFEMRSLRRFSQGWWLTRETRRGAWVADLRFGAFRQWDDRGLALRPVFAWRYQVDGRGDRLKPSRRGEPDESPDWSRLWARMWGETAGWDERPRLIGNPGVTSESLPTVR